MALLLLVKYYTSFHVPLWFPCLRYCALWFVFTLSLMLRWFCKSKNRLCYAKLDWKWLHWWRAYASFSNMSIQCCIILLITVIACPTLGKFWWILASGFSSCSKIFKSKHLWVPIAVEMLRFLQFLRKDFHFSRIDYFGVSV